MAEPSVSTRWWENYLVRYFLPSLAGMLIIYWMVNNSNLSSFVPKFLPPDLKDFGTAHLILWLLFGSLYCYVASYPALVFHATRVIDFRNVGGQRAECPYLFLNPYALSVEFAIWEGLCAFYAWPKRAFVGLAVFVAAQLIRIVLIRVRGPFGYQVGFDSSIAYSYLKKLSKRRSIITTTEEDGEETTESDAKDMVDSYRHLREHGNTALIVLLEIALAPMLYLAAGSHDSHMRTAIFLGALAFWVLPSVLIHGTAQHLERRFSRFRYSLRERGEHQKEKSETDTATSEHHQTWRAWVKIRREH